MVNQSGGFCTVDEALEALRRGEMIIVVDDEKRENEGDLLMAAEKASPEAVNFMAAKGRGLICLSLTAEQVKRLGLKMMTDVNESSHETAFTETIEARHGVTTGISAFDRSKTIRTAINPKASPADIVKPGHVFPLKAKEGGVLERAGHTEAAVDLMRMAGMNPSGVICEIMKDDG
ncbi:MAG TPA: 3,4-dihydroxy-2-butanone-4-phosphate synthase, partial [Candidatus Mcinerneyibacteriales bacterium]|nr:3,4-dihydroxy-2-butanone-4-phosphate synthase [Candidatus Mcinerneyibacteriales bacterium]